MNKIRVQNKHQYVIEVNDDGDTISFNVDDPTLPLKFDNAMMRLDAVQQNLKAEEQIIKKKEDKETKGILSQNTRKLLEAEVKACKDLRGVFDEFLGEGACKKIFGDTNYLGMFQELMEQLEPHFAIMKLDAEHYKKAVEEKYKEDEDEDVLS